MNKRNRLITMVAVLIAIIVIVVVLPLVQAPSKTKTISTKYQTARFDIEMEEVDGDYANEYLENSRASLAYPSKQPWVLLHAACLKSDIRKKSKFLGVGNTCSVGTIWQKNFTSLRTTIDSLRFDPAFINRVTKRGNESSCGTSMQINAGLFGFLNVQPKYFENINGELGVLVRQPKKTTVFVESFVPVDLLTGDLFSYLDTSESVYCSDYLRWLTEEGNLICTWTYEVKGVSVMVETKDTISTTLKAQLQDTIRSIPIKGKLQTSYTYIDNHTIKITAHNAFYAVGGIQRVKKVMERKF
jgi:hypothetical protein